MGDLDDRMWSMFLDSLAQKVANVSRAEFLPTSGLALANWEVMDTTGLASSGGKKKKGPAPGDPDINGIIGWADPMPKWRPTYVPGSSLYNAYVDFLNSIELKGGDPAQQQIADAYAVKVREARKKLTKDQNAMSKAFDKWTERQAKLPENARETYQQWYATNWASTISSDLSNLAAQDKQYRQALQKVGGPDYQTISSALTRATLTPNAGNTLTDAFGMAQPRYGISPRLNDWFLGALQTVTKGAKPKIDFTVDLSRAHEYTGGASNFVNTSVGGHYGGFSWAGSASVSYEQAEKQEDFSELLTSLQLRYTAQDATVFNVAEPPWFDASMIRRFGGQVPESSSVAPLFGPDGSMNLRTRQLVVVFKPTISLIGSEQTITDVRKAFDQQAGGTISVGGFAWSADASVEQGRSSHSADVKEAADGTALTVEDNTNHPKVVGVIPQQLG